MGTHALNALSLQLSHHAVVRLGFLSRTDHKILPRMGALDVPQTKCSAMLRASNFFGGSAAAWQLPRNYQGLYGLTGRSCANTSASAL